MKNQFRSLDEDEVDFLDSVLESTRAKEAEVQKQTREQLYAFRQAQEEAEKVVNQENESSAPDSTEAWTSGHRKRKKGGAGAIGGVKLRRISTSEKQPAPSATEAVSTQSPQASPERIHEPPERAKPIANTTELTPTPKTKETDTSTLKSQSPAATAAGLGLAAYSSDEEE